VTQEPQTESLATRRGVLAGVGLVSLASAITACGAGAGTTTPAAPAGSAGSAVGAGSTTAATALAATSQIPVGSGKIFTGPRVVVTQPAAGDFKAFSAVCTHMGCIVNQISDGTIDCPCHGSQYSITTGDVVAGPAPSPLPAKQITVSGGSVFLD
jgi:Rieske Fe-S protein